MTAPTLMAQMPNKTGNQSKHVPPQPKSTGNGKVLVSRPKANCGSNDGYRSSSFLK